VDIPTFVALTMYGPWVALDFAWLNILLVCWRENGYDRRAVWRDCPRWRKRIPWNGWWNRRCEIHTLH